MFETLNRNLNKLYKFSGYVAAIFLIFVAVFILIGISSRIFGFYIRGLAEYSGYCMAAASFFAFCAILSSRQMYLPGDLATSKFWFYVFLILFSFCSLPMFSLILAHTNDFIPKEKFVAAGASLQFTFGMGAMGGPFLCSIFMGYVGPNGFFIFLLFFHVLIGIYGIYRSRVRPVVENPDSKFVAMPQSITPAGIELNPTTEPIEEPIKPVTEIVVEENKPL